MAGRRLFTGTLASHRYGPTPAAAADAVPTQTIGLGPCGPVAAGCYGASAAAVHSQSRSLRLGPDSELELEGVLLVLEIRVSLSQGSVNHPQTAGLGNCVVGMCMYLHVSQCWFPSHVSIMPVIGRGMYV
jgi:hypothetical protein